MTFTEFKEKYQKVPVVEYPNARAGKQPLVTIKIITYNHVKFISECLDSVLDQKTNFDYEILIAEDASNDGTRDICTAYAEKHPEKIKLLLNSRENNIHIDGKPTGTFNNAHANYHVQSKYICILEGDDYWTDVYSLQKRVDFLEKNSDYVSCFHNISIIENEELLFPKGKLSYGKNTTIASKDMINTYMPTNTVLSRNLLVAPFEEALIGIICGDMVARGKLSEFGKAMFLNNVEPAVYRKHSNGIFSLKDISFRNNHALKANQYLIEFFEKNNKKSLYAKQSFIEAHIIYFVNTLKETRKLDFSLIKKGFKESQKHNISFFKVLKRYVATRLKKI